MSGLADELSRQVLSGSLLVGLPIAALAGLVSFASPCVLPLVPGYLGYVSGLSGVAQNGTGDGTTKRSPMLLGAVLFVLGFSVVFVVAGFTVGALGESLIRWQRPLTRVLGIVVIVMGLMFLGLIPGSGTDKRIDWRPKAGLAGAPLLGMVFGLGWAPCIGPVFSAVTALALSSGGALRGAVLAFAYCLGLGLPFLLVAAGLGRGRALTWIKAHRMAITRFGGAMLLAVGVLLLTGLWTTWIDQLRLWLEGGGAFQTAI